MNAEGQMSRSSLLSVSTVRMPYKALIDERAFMLVAEMRQRLLVPWEKPLQGSDRKRARAYGV